MTWLLLLGLAALTYGSRVLGLVAAPRLTGRTRDLLEALPAPLFAGLAVASVAGGGGLPDPPLLGAFAGALAVVLVHRTLPAALVGGAIGLGIGALIGVIM